MSTNWDETHLKSFLEGDEVAFSYIRNKFNGRLYGFLFSKLKVKEDAEDLTADTFELLWKKRADVTAFANIEGWLFTTAKYKYLEFLREKNRRLKIQTDANHLEDSPYDVMRSKLVDEVQPYIITMDAFLRLSLADQEALRLRIIDRLSVDKMAEHFGMTTKEVYNLLKGAKRRFKSILLGKRFWLFIRLGTPFMYLLAKYIDLYG